MSEFICEDQELPVCPKCGHKMEDPWGEYAFSDEFELTCDKCGQEFCVMRTFIARYDTEIKH